MSKDIKLPSKKEIKKHIDSLPYYGHCTDEYNEGFEDGIEWLKEQIKNQNKEDGNKTNTINNNNIPSV